MLRFPAGKPFDRHGYYFHARTTSPWRFERVYFFDSRASTTASRGPTIAERLAGTESGDHLLVCRPLDSTVFFSLLNALASNPLRAPILVTNLGFVDFTPKKSEIIEDIEEQGRQAFPARTCRRQELGTFPLQEGVQTLYSLDLFPLAAQIRDRLLVAFQRVVLVETNEFPPGTMFPRRRPPSFFEQLRATNRFLREIAAGSDRIRTLAPVPLPGDPLDLSYDGVHFTDEGHLETFERIAGALDGEELRAWT